MMTQSRGAKGRDKSSAQGCCRRDVPRLTSAANEQWYREREHNSIVVEQTVTADLNTYFDITGAFKILGWENILKLQGKYYPRLIKEFYANINDKEAKGCGEIHSIVKGVDIVLTRSYLATLLGVSDVGPDFEEKKAHIVSDPTYTYTDAINNLGLRRALRLCPSKPYQFVDRQVFYTRTLNIRDRVIAHLLCHNIMPKASAFNEIRLGDIYFLDKMLNGLGDIPGIPLGSVIISEMRNVARANKANKSFCFPLILSKVFKDKGVDLDGEIALHSTIKDTIDDSTMANWGYTKVNEQWTIVSGEGRAYKRAKRLRFVQPLELLLDQGHNGGRDNTGTSSTPDIVIRPDDSPVMQLLKQIDEKCNNIQRQVTARLDQHEEQLKKLWTMLKPDA